MKTCCNNNVYVLVSDVCKISTIIVTFYAEFNINNCFTKSESGLHNYCLNNETRYPLQEH